MRPSDSAALEGGRPLRREPFGVSPDGDQIERVTLSNSLGISVSVITFGAAIQSLWLPSLDRTRTNVVLGCPDLEGYVASAASNFGAVVGRFANRIANGRFSLDGTLYELQQNEGDTTLHGGEEGFSSRAWSVAATSSDARGAQVVLRYVSPDGEMGFPGALTADVSYTLGADATLRLDYRATSTRPTVVNLSNHAYWNLAGEGAGPIDDHLLTVLADLYTPTNELLLPTGVLEPVSGTSLDFTTPKCIGTHPYDHNLALRPQVDGSLALAARLEEPASGRTLEVMTTEPGLQLYTADHLDGRTVGPSGQAYERRAGLALETQHFPDSPNQAAFPGTALRPGDTFASTTIYRFGLHTDVSS